MASSSSQSFFRPYQSSLLERSSQPLESESFTEIDINSNIEGQPAGPNGCTLLGRTRSAVLFEHHRKTEFESWWSKTRWAILDHERDARHRMSPNWGVKRSGVWQFFHEGALMSTGEPKVICRRCEAILKHPAMRSEKHGQIGGKLGNGHITPHLSSKLCVEIAGRKGLSQLTLQETSNPTRVV
jgi:hypothetical protein